MADWLEAFRGIPRYAGTTFARDDLADALAKRRAVRRERGNLLITVGELRAIAERIAAQSAALVAAQGGSLTALGPADLDEYEAARSAAWRAAVKVGILVSDSDDDSGWSALYDHAGRLVYQDHGSSVRAYALDGGWSVTTMDLPSFLDAKAGESFPDAMDKLTRLAVERGYRV